MKPGASYGGRAGAVLGMVLIFVLMLGILAATLTALTGHIGAAVSRDITDSRAFWAAEAGIEQAKTIGQSNRKRYAVIPRPDGAGMLLGSNVLSGVTDTGSYSVTILDDPSWDNSIHSVQKYVITSVGTAPGERTRTITVHAWLLNYAGYMHASHQENGVNFATGDILDGPVYTDDQLHIYGPTGPVFLQLACSASNSVDYNGDFPDGWTPTSDQVSAVWQGGLVLNAAPLDLEGRFGDHLTEFQIDTQAGGLELAGAAAADYAFNFKPDGSFTYSNMATHMVKNGKLSALNGTIYVDGTIYVQGVVSGRVTIGARHEIDIVSNLVYESASGTNPAPWDANFDYAAVKDMLGLMAGERVVVLGTNSIDIHASILTATNGFDAAANAQVIGGPYINLFGGMSQCSRGVVGHTVHPYEGFHKHYKFDQRYVSEGPPCFPPSLYQFGPWQ